MFLNRPRPAHHFRTEFATLEKLLAQQPITPMHIRQVADDEKCGGCNWRVANLYFAAVSPEQAQAMYKENDSVYSLAGMATIAKLMLPFHIDLILVT